MTDLEINIEILKKLNLVQSYTTGNVMCHCPFHKDHTPSLSVNVDKGIWNCFSCHRHGTLRSLFYELKGHGINKELGIKSDFKEQSDVNPFAKVRTSFSVLKEDEELKATPETHVGITGSFIPAENFPVSKAYLEKRKISLNIAHSMKMSYATLAKSYDLLDPKNKAQQVNLTGRLLIPVYENHKLISCEARDIKGKEAYHELMQSLGKPEGVYKKCIYPKGSSVNTLFDLDTLDRNKTLYFVEGIMDLAVLRSSKIFDETNSTSIFGAGITKRQVYLLSQFKKFVFIVDDDVPGLGSAVNLIHDLKNYDHTNKEWKFLIPPFHEQGVKDVGDIPVKTAETIDSCIQKRWLNKERDLVSSEEFLKRRMASI